MTVFTQIYKHVVREVHVDGMVGAVYFRDQGVGHLAEEEATVEVDLVHGDGRHAGVVHHHLLHPHLIQDALVTELHVKDLIRRERKAPTIIIHVLNNTIKFHIVEW